MLLAIFILILRVRQKLEKSREALRETKAAITCLDPNNSTTMPDPDSEENGYSDGTHDQDLLQLPNCTSTSTTINDHHLLLHHDPTYNNNNNTDDLSMELDHLQNDHPHLIFFNNSTLTAIDTANHHDHMGSYDHEFHVTTTNNDLFTLLHSPTTSISFGSLGELSPAMAENPSGSGSSTVSYDPSSAAHAMSYDPLFHLNLPLHQPSPLLRDLMFHHDQSSLPTHGHGYTAGIPTKGINGNSSSLFGGLDEGDQGNTFNGVVFEFGKSVADCLGNIGKDNGKRPKNFVSEQQRRQSFNDKYQHLKSLVPNPTKGDRASIVADGIEYIKELKRTVNELKLLVEKKRISKERIKRLNTEDVAAAGGGGGEHHMDDPGSVKPDPDEVLNGSAASQLRSSWLQRKCKDTEVDVRIVDDEVTIKLVQRKKINCLLLVSRTLDDLHLDLRHVAGGHVGDYYSFLFNTKICEGSSVYASAIANKLIEVVERHYAAAAAAVIPATHSF